MSDVTLESIWGDDLLDRKNDAAFLETFLVKRMEERKATGRNGAYVLNIDAAWGFGKSFFMSRFKQQLKLSNHPVVLIDAWKNDFSDDPYINVIAEIEQYFQSYFEKERGAPSALRNAYDAVTKNAAKITWIALKGGAKRLSRYVIAEGTDEIREVIDQHVMDTGKTGQSVVEDIEKQFVEITDGIIDNFAKKRLEEFNEAKVSLERFRESLGNLLKIFEEQVDKKLPFFVLVDELDRCRPTYAIAMLERIKHLFDADNVVFVLSTDTEQLAHSINAVYGNSFDSRRYLQRFFARTYELPKPDNDQLISSLIAMYQPDTEKWAIPGVETEAHEYLSKVSSHYGMSLREIEQTFDILANITTVWDVKVSIQIALMFPLILGHLRRENIDDYSTPKSWVRQLVMGHPDWFKTEKYSNGYNERRETIGMGTYVVSLIDMASGTLYEAMRRDLNDETVGLVPLYTRSAARQEYTARFGNIVQERPKSILNDYPKMIRYAGRLSIGV